MSRLRALVALALFLGAVLVALHAAGGSGATLLAFALAIAALDVFSPALAPAASSIDEACELVAAEHRPEATR